MLTLATTSQFRRDYRKAKRRGLDMGLLQNVIDTLLAQQPLPDTFRDHPLSGSYEGFRECHIQPDWLLIYLVNRETLILTATRTGTHADLFGKKKERA